LEAIISLITKGVSSADKAKSAKLTKNTIIARLSVEILIETNTFLVPSFRSPELRIIGPKMNLQLKPNYFNIFRAMIQYLYSRINLIHNIDDEVRVVYIAIDLNL